MYIPMSNIHLKLLNTHYKKEETNYYTLRVADCIVHNLTLNIFNKIYFTCLLQQTKA